MTKLVEISSIEFPPQLIDHQAQHMLETFTRNVEQQGLQLPQYLRLVGKEQDAFEQEIRVEAETRVRRSLALDAFADAEQIGVEQTEIEDEVHRAAAGADEAAAVEAPGAGQSDHDAARAGSHARAQGDGAAARAGDRRRPQWRQTTKQEKPADRAETSDTGTQSREAASRRTGPTE